MENNVIRSDEVPADFQLRNVMANASKGADYDPDCLKEKIRNNPELSDEFERIIGRCEVTYEVRHERADADVNIDFEIFYRYFFSKYVSNLQGKDAQSDLIDNHASIFPFKTDPNLPTIDVPMQFDDVFLDEIRLFVEHHFEHPDFRHLIDLFVVNVANFKTRNFTNVPYSRLKRIAESGSNLNCSWRSGPPGHLSNYLENLPRLNSKGVWWYKYFGHLFNKISVIFSRQVLPEKSEIYFRNLAEINCSELLLLVERRFYDDHPKQYGALFKKYLFFFGHAVKRADAHPVFSIDDTLFECLKSKRVYEKCQECADDVLNLQWELWMMTLVHCRKNSFIIRRNINFELDQNNLQNVITFAKQIPHIQSAIVYYRQPEHPRFSIFLLLQDVFFLICYSPMRRVSPRSHYKEILKSALLSRQIKTIKYYNAYLGEEASVNMPQKWNEIREFIRQHNKSFPVYPKTYITFNLTSHFKYLRNYTSSSL